MSQSTCPKCHRSATWSAKWQTCSACSPPFEVRVISPLDARIETHIGRIVSAEVFEPDKNSVTFHVEHNEVFSRRKDGICPRCARQPKSGTGYCRDCTNMRARERRMLTTSGRPPGRPRKASA